MPLRSLQTISSNLSLSTREQPSQPISQSISMMKRNMRRKNGAKRKLQEVFASDDDADEEFEIDKIVGERVEDDCVQYEVKWTGYDTDENTWEPAEHLSAATINAWKKRKAAVRSKNPPTQRAFCPVCHEPDALGRSCETCKAAMHHFCSHDVCM